MKRRQFVKTAGLAALTLAGAGSASFFFLKKNSFMAPPVTGNFNLPLPIPPLLENLDKTGATARFKLRAQQGSMSFLPGKETRTSGYNGNYLGPTIKVRNGQKFTIQVENNLPETTTLHWHGLHLPAQWDGGPRQPVLPASSWNPDFTIKQQAATLWYHPHAMGKTGEQVYQGLAGMFLIEDEVSDRLPIPKTYGVDDIPVILQDRRFHTDGQFAYVQNRHETVNGVVGNYLLVNGAVAPTLEVEKSLIRLRLLNGSNASIYTISFSDRHPFHTIASDGGFLDHPVAMNAITLSAGERAEVVVDTATVTGQGLTLLVNQHGGHHFEAMKIKVSGKPDKTAKLPDRLIKNVRIAESEADYTRQFVMQTMGMGMMGGKQLSINGKKMDINRIDEKIRLGATEIWEISNQSAMMMNMPHSMHLHDVQFHILDRNGRTPPPHEQGRKDTVLIPPGEKVRIISRFQDYKGIYMYHCHLLEHEDDGMMGQFEVI